MKRLCNTLKLHFSERKYLKKIVLLDFYDLKDLNFNITYFDVL